MVPIRMNVAREPIACCLCRAVDHCYCGESLTQHIEQSPVTIRFTTPNCKITISISILGSACETPPQVVPYVCPGEHGRPQLQCRPCGFHDTDSVSHQPPPQQYWSVFSSPISLNTSKLTLPQRPRSTTRDLSEPFGTRSPVRPSDVPHSKSSLFEPSAVLCGV